VANRSVTLGVSLTMQRYCWSYTTATFRLLGPTLNIVFYVYSLCESLFKSTKNVSADELKPEEFKIHNTPHPFCEYCSWYRISVLLGMVMLIPKPAWSCI